MIFKTSQMILILVWFPLIIWLLLEYFLWMFGTLLLETLYISHKLKWDLGSIYSTFYGLSWAFFTIITFGLIILITISICKNSLKSLLYCFIEGLSTRSKIRKSFYFIHFFGVWIIISILIFCTPFGNSKLLVGLMFGF